MDRQYLITIYFRNDNFEQAVGTMMSLGATVLKVGVTKMLETSSSSSTPSGVNKIGEAASTSQLTPEEQLHQQQVRVVWTGGRDYSILAGPSVYLQADPGANKAAATTSPRPRDTTSPRAEPELSPSSPTAGRDTGAQWAATDQLPGGKHPGHSGEHGGRRGEPGVQHVLLHIW